MQRIKSRQQFQAVLTASTVARTQHFALHQLVLGGSLSDVAGRDLFVFGESWLGAVVPKRWARRAVTRHLIKRQIYVVGKRFEPDLVHVAQVVRLRSGFDKNQFISACSDVLKHAVRSELELLLAQNSGSLARPELTS